VVIREHKSNAVPGKDYATSTLDLTLTLTLVLTDYFDIRPLLEMP